MRDSAVKAQPDFVLLSTIIDPDTTAEYCCRSWQLRLSLFSPHASAPAIQKYPTASLNGVAVALRCYPHVEAQPPLSKCGSVTCTAGAVAWLE